ncbi:hypothetical protein QZH41_017023 [Actinostola sp. cb2023]|nr:hypothetical protein QZH41_017023 [Actinostola sp. cb2023]
MTFFTPLLVLPDDFKYDAFICYAREDLEFANTILRTLESKPFHLKLCINYRDILPGSDELSTIVNVIEDRCLKVVVIISSHFNQDEDADFQAKIALRLSPGCRKKRLIPIVCDGKEFVPRILKHITHLDYANMAAREYFWPNLARSLGYTG